jgi:pimeloyl-ACP methyl ester carboxylesterase
MPPRPGTPGSAGRRPCWRTGHSSEKLDVGPPLSWLATAALVIRGETDPLERGKGFGPLIEALTPAGRPRPSAEQIQQVNRWMEASNDVKALAAVMRGMHNLAVADDQLKDNRVPALALIGELDPLKKGVDDLKGRMPNLRLVVIAGADHMTAFTRPEFIQELKAFLDKHRQREKERDRGSSARGR